MLSYPVKFVRTKFINNESRAKHSSEGGAINTRSPIELINCLFVNNRAIGGDGSTSYTTVRGGAVMTNPEFWNGDSWVGGTVKVLNSTFVNNYTNNLSSYTSGGDSKGGAFYGGWTSGNKVYMLNTIIWGTRTLINGTDSESHLQNTYEKDVHYSKENVKLIVDYSNIQYSPGATWTCLLYTSPSPRD